MSGVAPPASSPSRNGTDRYPHGHAHSLYRQPLSHCSPRLTPPSIRSSVTRDGPLASVPFVVNSSRCFSLPAIVSPHDITQVIYGCVSFHLVVFFFALLSSLNSFQSQVALSTALLVTRTGRTRFPLRSSCRPPRHMHGTRRFRSLPTHRRHATHENGRDVSRDLFRDVRALDEKDAEWIRCPVAVQLMSEPFCAEISNN